MLYIISRLYVLFEKTSKYSPTLSAYFNFAMTLILGIAIIVLLSIVVLTFVKRFSNEYKAQLLKNILKLEKFKFKLIKLNNKASRSKYEELIKNSKLKRNLYKRRIKELDSEHTYYIKLKYCLEQKKEALIVQKEVLIAEQEVDSIINSNRNNVG